MKEAILNIKLLENQWHLAFETYHHGKRYLDWKETIIYVEGLPFGDFAEWTTWPASVYMTIPRNF